MVRTLLGVAVALLVSGSLLWADEQGDQASGSKHMVQGTIKKIDTASNTLTLTTTDGSEKEFKLTDQTRVMQMSGTATGGSGEEGSMGRGSSMAMSDLKEGMKVTLTLSKDKDNSSVVKIIRIGPK